MTEQEFQKQVWRPYDQITTADGVRGKVLNVCFPTKSVRAYIGGSPEWVRCELIETHTTGKGADGDDAAIIEELHNKLMKAEDTITGLKRERQQLTEKYSNTNTGDLMTGINLLKDGLAVKKSKIERIERALDLIDDALTKINGG